MPYANVPRVARLRRVDSFDLLNSYDRIKAAALILADACGGKFNGRLALALQPAIYSGTVPE
jgi:hypothetical protein